jgi:hypothetical protein
MIGDEGRRAMFDRNRNPWESEDIRDPFEIFNQFFEQRGHPFDDPFFSNHRPPFSVRSPFDDPFFSNHRPPFSVRSPFDDPFFALGSRTVNSFQNDPFERGLNGNSIISQSQSCIRTITKNGKTTVERVTIDNDGTKTKYINGKVVEKSGPADRIKL